MYIDPIKTENLHSFLDNEHFRYKRNNNNAVPLANEIDLSKELSIEICTDLTPLLAQMKKDFCEFLTKCMGVNFSENNTPSKNIIFTITENKTGNNESFFINTSEECIQISAEHERGLLHASHYLEKMFSFRGAPFFEIGSVEKSPEFNPRISQEVFCMADGSIKMLTDNYLSLMSHFGINGIHIYMKLWDYCKNARIPQLNTKKYNENIAELKELCDFTAKYGIDIYPVVRNESFKTDDPIFTERHDIIGARLNFPVPDNKDRYCLCSSNADVLACYNETFGNLFKDVPQIKGAFLCVGGEGFIHCFTRSKEPNIGGTSCPHCANRNPSKDIANLLNGIGNAVNSVRPGAKVFAWPYSATIWSGEEDFAQTQLINYLQDNVEMISNFDTPCEFKLGDSCTNFVDYNIVNIGPSETFKAQSVALEAKNKQHYAKIESSTEPGWFFLPYLPVHYRWFERINRLKEYNVPGYISKWRFYGFTGSLPEEILSEMIWDNNLQADELLMKIASRDFGNVSEQILDGWRILSDTWAKIPASHMIYGEREYYMKGPAYLGPAHPLIFDPQKKYDLCKKFFTLRGDNAELLSPEEIEEIEKIAPPRYSSDLLIVYPFGVDTLLDAFPKVIKEWDKGIQLIADSLGENKNARAIMELDVCTIIGIHLRAIYNTIRFFKARNDMFTTPGTMKSLEDSLGKLVQIINDEIANAKNAIPILERDVRIGYGHCYGQVYDLEMILDKIRQCEYVRDMELPEIRSGIAFHVHNIHIRF